MQTHVKLSLLGLMLVAIATTVSVHDPASARGGFGGGGGGFRGGFGGGFGGDRGDFDGGFGRFGGSDYARDFDRDMGGFDRMDQPVDGRPDRAANIAQPRSDDTGVRTWNDGAAARNLSTDGGFGHVMGAGTAQRYGTYRMSPADLADRGGYVRQGFDHYDWFNRNWWANHPYAWYNRYWDDYWPWGWSDWGVLAPFWGADVDTEPVYYDYGDNITYDGDTVYYGTQPQASAGDYYQQAETLASSAPVENTQPTTPQQQTAYSKEWKPLGVFSLVQNQQGGTSQMMQLCVNAKGIIRGNYYNALTDETKPIKGAVDKKSLRACWTVGSNSKVVYDTGVGNLMRDQSPVLIHYSKTNTQQWLLVRMQKPAQATKASS